MKVTSDSGIKRKQNTTQKFSVVHARKIRVFFDETNIHDNNWTSGQAKLRVSETSLAPYL